MISVFCLSYLLARLLDLRKNVIIRNRGLDENFLFLKRDLVGFDAYMQKGPSVSISLGQDGEAVVK